MYVLVLNSGSSSLRFQVIRTDLEQMEAEADECLARGVVERVGSLALITFRAEGQPRIKREQPLRDHRAAIDAVLRWLISPEARIEGLRALGDIHAVGHRVVHGGQRFQASVRIDDEVLTALEDMVELAPLHNPANIRGVRACRELLGADVPQVAVFDTAFHATMPETSYLYAIPYHFYRRFGVRRYGFHGTSHRYIAYRYRRLTGKRRKDVKIITLHLGNGASACAIRGGDSFDTSMGFTPLEGLVMGTRSGDIDPSVIDYISHKEGLGLAEMITVLNKHSGLLGISGMTSDVRELMDEAEEHQDRRVLLALDMFAKRVRKYIGGYYADLGGADAVCFAGGIGENAAPIRARICEGLESLGLTLDPGRNEATVQGATGEISTDASRMKAYVIPTNEELLIARDTVRVVEGAEGEKR